MKIKTFLKEVVKNFLPYGVILIYHRLKKQKSARLSYGNDSKSYCPICKKTGYFQHFGYSPRAKAQCPYCGSLERHRILWLFLQRKTDIFMKGTKIFLHVAAEPCFEKHFRKIYGKNYLTADLKNIKARVKMDITNIRYPNESFDIIICNHVLEHVNDDIKAMSELYRVLKNNGWAILLVPIMDIEKTFEDNSIITEIDRERAFGQKDHVRKYGKDYEDRLKSVGFNVTIISLNEFADDKEIKNMRLGKDKIYYCKK